MYIDPDSPWSNPDSPWWAKANRAKEHLDELRRLVDGFRDSDPYSLTPEPTDVPDRLAYRLRYLKPIPTRFNTLIGDVLHNLRAALESLAFEMARVSNGGTLTDAQERASAFPICLDPDSFDAFFGDRRRVGLYDERARRAFRQFQPFVHLEQAHRLSIATDETFEDRLRWSDLHRLNVLWNIDKHRRLALLAWWPDILYWSSNGPSNRRAYRGDGTLADGSILLYIEGRDEGMGDQINQEFKIVLTDDPAFVHAEGMNTDVVALLEGWHQRITMWMFPVVFTAMSRPVAST